MHRSKSPARSPRRLGELAKPRMGSLTVRYQLANCPRSLSQPLRVLCFGYVDVGRFASVSTRSTFRNAWLSYRRDGCPQPHRIAPSAPDGYPTGTGAGEPMQRSTCRSPTPGRRGLKISRTVCSARRLTSIIQRKGHTRWSWLSREIRRRLASGRRLSTDAWFFCIVAVDLKAVLRITEVFAAPAHFEGFCLRNAREANCDGYG